jgi:hypothetical protein
MITFNRAGREAFINGKFKMSGRWILDIYDIKMRPVDTAISRKPMATTKIILVAKTNGSFTLKHAISFKTRSGLATFFRLTRKNIVLQGIVGPIQVKNPDYDPKHTPIIKYDEDTGEPYEFQPISEFITDLGDLELDHLLQKEYELITIHS